MKLPAIPQRDAAMVGHLLMEDLFASAEAYADKLLELHDEVPQVDVGVEIEIELNELRQATLKFITLTQDSSGLLLQADGTTISVVFDPDAEEPALTFAIDYYAGVLALCLKRAFIQKASR